MYKVITETGQLGPRQFGPFLRQLGPPYGQLGPLFKDNSDHFSRTTRTNI